MTKIVQCPSCNTKFALNESQLAGIESPKFQCSRCKTVFALDDESSKRLSTQEWNLGNKKTISTEEPEEDLLKDFSIDVSKFSLGVVPALLTPKDNEPSEQAEQLDFGFNNPTISHQQTDTHQDEANIPEPTEKQPSQKESPTQRISRISPELLDSLVYGESGTDDSKISVSWDNKEHKTNDSSDLLEIFRGGSQRSSTGSYDIQTIISETEMVKPTSELANISSPSWSQLKEKMEKQDEEEVPFKNFNDPAEALNRSMKNTTVIKRDELEVEGFMKAIESDEDDFSDYPLGHGIRNLKFNWNIKDLLKGISYLILNLKTGSTKLAPFTKSLILAWAIPGIFLMFLFLWGNSLNNKNTLNGAESIFANAVALFTPPEVLLPPVDLVLNTITAELRPDKTGDPMIIISGFIFNAGVKTVLNPTFEARTFDKGNTFVKSIKAPIPNELSRFASSINLTEISKEEILALQNQRSWDGIAPSKSVPFKVVVTDIGSGYKYFSAKIYSVSEIS